MLFPTNATNLIIRVLLKNDSDVAITGILHSNVSLSVGYNLQASGAWVSPSLVDGTLGVYLANSWKEIGAGIYQWCPPNAAIVANTATVIRAIYSTNKPLYDTIEARLPAGSITGPFTRIITVNDVSTGNPIELAKVRLYRTGESETKETDVNGEASFTTEAATFSYAVVAPGYVAASGTIVISANGSTTIPLTAIAVVSPALGYVARRAIPVTVVDRVT
jgi:hypothetical protein